MNTLRGLAVILVASLPIFVYAQSEDRAREIENKRSILIQKLIWESQSLRRAENRAIVYAKIGNALWIVDSSGAKKLYAQAVNELLNAQSIAEADDNKDGAYQDLLMSSNTRPNVLNTIAVNDPEFALQSLYSTRPRLVAEALAAFRANGKRSEGSQSGNSYHLAQNELSLEDSLISKTTQQDPALAAARIREKLKNDLSGMTWGLLQTLLIYDEASANSIGDEIIRKITSKGFLNGDQPDHQNINLATTILSHFLQTNNSEGKFIRFDETQLKAMAEKLILSQIRLSERQQGWVNPELTKYAEKLAPALFERMSAVQKAQEVRSYGGPDAYAARKFIEANPQPETLLAEAGKFAAPYRSQIYQSAASRLASRGDFAAAFSVISENLSDGEMQNALDSLKGQYAYQLINKGQFAEAESIVGEMSPNNRFYHLISLARTARNRNPTANSAFAAAVLDRARSQLPPEIETGNDLQQLMQLISAFAESDPPRAFREFEAVIPKLNELDSAFSVVNRFNNNYNVKDGEYPLTNGFSFGYYLDQSVISTLGLLDLEQTLAIIDKLGRREARILLILHLLESGQFRSVKFKIEKQGNGLRQYKTIVVLN